MSGPYKQKRIIKNRYLQYIEDSRFGLLVTLHELKDKLEKTTTPIFQPSLFITLRPQSATVFGLEILIDEPTSLTNTSTKETVIANCNIAIAYLESIEEADIGSINRTTQPSPVAKLASKSKFPVPHADIIKQYCEKILALFTIADRVAQLSPQKRKEITPTSSLRDLDGLLLKSEYQHATTHKQSFLKKRWHRYEASCETLDPKYEGLSGDRLKTQILIYFKASIENIKSIDELNTIVSEFKKDNNPEYLVLKQGQGLATRLFDLKTSSLEALDKIIEGKEKELNPGPQNQI